jgi:RNA polymerase sigma-70 factor (ECF subfamily)
LVFPVCLRFAKNRQQAEEILQEGFLKVFTNLYQYKAIGSFEGWLRKIMVNTALAMLKKKAKNPAVYPINMLTENGSVTTSAEDDISVKELIVLVQRLPTAYRMVFNLYVFEGLKHREIAELLDISEGTSKSNLSDARKILQRSVKKMENFTANSLRKLSNE